MNQINIMSKKVANLNLLEYYSCNKTANINEMNAFSLFFIASNFKIYCYIIFVLLYLQTSQNKTNRLNLNIYGI